MICRIIDSSLKDHVSFIIILVMFVWFRFILGFFGFRRGLVIMGMFV